jgi:hypothetical protein
MDLVTRAKNILLTPKTEWPFIAGETTPMASLFTGYVLPLAAIGPIATVVGQLLFGGGVSMAAIVVLAIATFVMAFVAVYVVALIASKVAPSFGGKDDMGQALKLVAYSYTASWVGAIFNLVPAISLLGVIAAIYGLYILFTGTSPMLSVPKEKSVGYTAVVILVAIGLYIVIGIVIGVFVGAIIATTTAMK